MTMIEEQIMEKLKEAQLILETVLAAGSKPDATALAKSEAAEAPELLREVDKLRRILFSRLLRRRHQGTA